jgi:peptidoglycan hydrolase CwlO-like protein
VQKNIDNIEDQIKAVKTTMKELEKQYEKSRTVIIKRTQYGGVRKRYLKTKL